MAGVTHPEIQSGLEALVRVGLKRLRADALPVLVASHERSGTHFAMNTLAACFGYASSPWIDLDRHTFNINYFHPDRFGQLLQTLAELRTASIAKSHHEVAFFRHILDEVRGLRIVYIYRHPADVLASFWRWIASWPSVEGPKTDSLPDFAKAAPMGQLMRYQHRQYVDMLDRWASHVHGWVNASTQFDHVHLVRYEDLARDFAGSVDRLAEVLKVAPIRCVRPRPEDHGVGPGPIPFVGVEKDGDRRAVATLAVQRYPDLMGCLGYLDATLV